MKKTGLLVLGNQLFEPKLLKDRSITSVFMREDRELCTYEKFHKLKIILFLSAMRSYADELREDGHFIDYQELDATVFRHYGDALADWLARKEIQHVLVYEIEDKFFEKRVLELFEKVKVSWEILPSPMFLTTRLEFKSYLAKNRGKPFMRTFYESQRARLGVLIEPDGSPTGGRWSFDDQNRKPLPKYVDPPKLMARKPTSHTLAVREMCELKFQSHPGRSDKLWFATRREDAKIALEHFLYERFSNFGAYEDAISQRSIFPRAGI